MDKLIQKEMSYRNLFIKIKFILLFFILTFYTLQNSYSQWTQIGNFGQGVVSGVYAFDDILCATTYNKGFYASNFNNNPLWIMRSFRTDFHFLSLCPDPYSPYTAVIAGTDKGIIRSYNLGIVWDSTNVTHDTVYCLKLDTANYSYRVYAGTSSHLYSSINGGTVWIPTSLNKSITGIEILSGSIIASANDNIYSSSNGGLNWIASDFQQKAFSLSVLYNKVYAGAPYGIYYSTNKGINWIATSLHNDNIYKWGIGTAGNNLIAYSSSGIYLSTNDGATWNQRSTFNQGNSYYFGYNKAYITSDKGIIYFSADFGLSWNINNLNNAHITTLNYSPGIFLAGTNTVYGDAPGQEIGLYYSTNIGISWTQYSDFQNKNMTALASNGNMILAAYDGILKKTTNNGTSWNTMNLNVPFGISTLAIKGNTDTVFAGVRALQGIRKSADGGSNWSTMPLSAFNINGFVFLKDKIFAATQNDGQSPYYGIFVSFDQGQTWNRTVLDSKDAISITLAGNRIFVASPDTLFYSDDIGNSWHPMPPVSLGENDCIFAIDSLHILTGTFGDGIYYSTNSGLSWQRKNEGYFDNYNYISKFIRAGNYIYCGTYFGGLWKRPISDFVGIDNEQNIVPINYSLEQNYPNPFNSSTIIKYSVSKAADITIKIFDIIGREMVTLTEGYKIPGKYQVSFSGENLTSGIYFYRLEAKTYSETKKMIIIK